MLRRSAEESGLDSRNLRSLSGRYELYPDILLHSSGKKMDLSEKEKASNESGNASSDSKKQQKLNTPARTPSTIYLIAKMREIHYRIQNSPFHVKPDTSFPDVVRYSTLNKERKDVLSSCFNGKTETVQGKFIPDELLGSSTKKLKRKKTGGVLDGLTLEQLAKQELLSKGEEEEGEEEEEALVDEGEEEEGEDYVMDYYASADEDSAGGDEPVF